MLPELCLHPLVMRPQLWCCAALCEDHGTQDDVYCDSEPYSPVKITTSSDLLQLSATDEELSSLACFSFRDKLVLLISLLQ